MKATPKAANQADRNTPAQSRKPLAVIAAAVAAMMAMSGCAIQRIDNAQKESESHAKTAESYLDDLRNRPDLANSRAPLRKMDKIWVDTTPMPLTNRSLGAPVTALDCNITFNPKSPITLAEFGRVVTNLCGLSVNVTQDATALLNGTLMSNAGAGAGSALSGTSSGAISTAALPPPNLGMGNQPVAAPISNSVFGSGQNDMISGISWVNKPLRGLLDLVTARLGLGWKYEDNTAVIYFTDTQVFQLYAIPGKTSMETTVKSGAEKSSASGSGETTSAFSADGSSQETGVEFETDIMGDIEKTLKTMVTPGLGRLSVSSSTGTVTVTDRPDVLRVVKEYITSENKRITRQVLLNVKVLSVQIEDGDSAGVNWKAVYDRVNSQIGNITSNFAKAAGGFAGSIGIINGGRWDGTELFINALSSQGRVSTLSSPSVTTLNLKPAPILVGTQTTYLAQVSTNVVEGGGTSQQSLTPGTVTTGFNMTLLPYLMEGPEMLLQYSINLSSLTGMKTIESGENKIEMPEVDNRIFSQSVRLRSGETLVLAGFDQSVTNSTKEGVGDSGFWLLGGKGDRAKKRDVIVVLITPIVTD